MYPGKVDPKKLKEWVRDLTTYLDSMDVVNKVVPLSYTTRDNDEDLDNYDDERKKLILLTPLVGAAFKKDNQHVDHILGNCLNSTKGYLWYHDITERDGRAAYWALKNHYDGDVAHGVRVDKAQSLLKQLHYCGSEQVFPFKRCITKMKEAFK